MHYYLKKYTPSDENIPSWKVIHNITNNITFHVMVADVICECINCKNSLEAVSKIKSHILNGDSADTIPVFDKSFNELMYEEVVKEYNIKLEEINELFD